MIYIVKDKPCVRCSSYYKPVEITKKGKEYTVKPIGDKTNRIYNDKNLQAVEMPLDKAYEKYGKNSINDSKSKNIDSLD